MRSSNILVLAWALSCSAATLPACGTSCVARAIKKTGCAANDSPCICNSEHYAGYLQYCFSKKCSASDEAAALKSATTICHIVSHEDDDSSKSGLADELRKRDAQNWWDGNRGGNNGRPANNPPPPAPAPGKNNGPAPPPPPPPPPAPAPGNNGPGQAPPPPPPPPPPPAPKPTPPPKPNGGGGPIPPPPPPTTTKPKWTTTTKHKQTTKPWKDHTTWTKAPPATTTKKHQTWYTPTQNPTVLAGILPGLLNDIEAAIGL